jgi:hypothetical protein
MIAAPMLSMTPPTFRPWYHALDRVILLGQAVLEQTQASSVGPLSWRIIGDLHFTHACIGLPPKEFTLIETTFSVCRADLFYSMR